MKENKIKTKLKDNKNTIKKTKKPDKKHAIGVTKKQLIGYTATIIITIIIIFMIIIPVLLGTLHFLVVLSGSMSPEIKPGDIVVSSYVTPKKIQKNDIITYIFENEPNKCITHRVINISYVNGKPIFQTKGDANEDPDTTFVKSNQVVGKLVFVLPYLGYLPNFARSKFGFIFLLIVPAFIIIIGESWNIVKTIKNTKRKKLD